VQPFELHGVAGVMCEADNACRRLVETGDAVEDRGLAGAVRPDQRGDLAPLGVEGEFVDGDDAAEAHRQAIDGQDVVVAHPCPSLTRSDEIAWLCFRNTVGARWPIRPRGRQIISSTIARPNTSMRYWSSPRNSSKPPIMASAARATPSCEPMPPSTTIASTSADSWKVKDSGLMNPCRVAKNAPAKP